ELSRCPARIARQKSRRGGWRSRLKLPTADPAKRLDLDPKIKPNGVTPGAAELFLISQVADKVEEPHQAPSLIQTPDLIITADRDARYRPPAEVTTEVLDRIAQRTALAEVLPSTLVVVAHPDDEAIGAGGLLGGLPDAVVVHVTDGAPRDERYAQSKGFATREEYARARRREVASALGHVGITPERIRGLGYVDGEASLQLLELVFDIADLIDEVRPEIVLTHPYEGGHTDHDATAFAVHLACGVLHREGICPPAVLELTSYHARNGKKVVQQFLPHRRADRGQRTVQLSEEDRNVKQRIFDSFDSQRHLLEHFSMQFERFRPAPRYVFTEPPHEGQLNYERYGDPDRGKIWREHAERALRALRMRRG